MKAPENNDKKGGFLAVLSKFFGGSAASGAASSGLGTAASGGLGGLFASKAGIVGMILGGATIAAGVGVIYNFIGPSSKPVYSPSLFENQYYESEVENASVKRAAGLNSGAAASSTSLDYFRDEAKKDGMEFGESDSEGAEASADGVDNSDSGSVEGEYSEGKGGYGGNSLADMPRLQKSAGFGASGGSQSKLSFGGGGMSGGIGSKFQKIYKVPVAGRGKSSSMKGALASKIRKAGKYSLPNFNKKGAYGQAKFAGKLGKQALYSASETGARTSATEAFIGETGGEGDVSGDPLGGSGLGGAGISDGASLKTSDPSLSSNESTPPEPGNPEKDNPWQTEENMAMNGMIIAAIFIGITMLLTKVKTPLTLAIAVGTAVLAMVAAVAVIYAGFVMMSQHGQKWMGMMYIAIGAMLMYQAYKALTGVGEARFAIDKGKDEALKSFWNHVPGFGA